MASTLQFLSGNRFILGIGAGWREEEYLAYGYDFPTPSVRFRQLEEAINVCRLMWTEEDPHFDGEFFHIAGADAPPLPAMPPPICIGTSGEQIGIPLAARNADIWNTVWRGNLDSLTRKRDVMLQELERLGRDREEVQFSLTIERPLPQTASEVDDFGTMLTGLIEIGMEHFVLDFGNPETADEADCFIADVMGPLRA
jgi:alkanesulfonate monooxygenase SsuD/methylene tetrahydromethanopterin reductase-like flavin-dependent oxidoreductase (luciferase family)